MYWWLSFQLWNLSFTSLVISCITCTWKAFPYNFWLCQLKFFGFFLFYFLSRAQFVGLIMQLELEMHHWGGRVGTFCITIRPKDYVRLMFSHHLVVTCWRECVCVLVWGLGFFFSCFWLFCKNIILKHQFHDQKSYRGFFLNKNFKLFVLIPETLWLCINVKYVDITYILFFFNVKFIIHTKCTEVTVYNHIVFGFSEKQSVGCMFLSVYIERGWF